MCPTFISKRGEFHPAKESVSLIYKGKVRIPKKDLPASVTIPGSAEFLEPNASFLYDGPDREALKVIQKEGSETGAIGMDFKSDPDFIQMTRTRGFNTVDEYLKAVGYDEEKDNKKFEEKASRVQAHDVEKQVDAIEVLAGGKDYAGTGADIVGGFGEEKMNKPGKK